MSEESVDYDTDDESLSYEDGMGPAQDTENKYNREVIIVHPNNRITPHRLTKFEMTRIETIRSEQIAIDNICMVDTTGLTDTVRMAKRELMMRKCPLTMRREVGLTADGKKLVEDWDPNTMEFSEIYTDI